MAQRVTVVLESDISGVTADETVTFGVDGVSYEIDLTTEEAEELRSALGRFVSAGRKIGRSGGVAARKRRPTEAGYAPNAVRAWANANGIEVSQRGRISKDVMDRYRAAGN